MAYNGWTNRQTWNVALWFNNEEPLYRACREQAAREPFTAASAEAFVRDMMPDGTPDFDGADDYAPVDWNAIAEAFNEE